jgi:hypothetical protein
MLNHCCRESDPTVRAVWARDPSPPLPVMVGVTRRYFRLRGGTELTYDYDAGFTFGPFTRLHLLPP